MSFRCFPLRPRRLAPAWILVLLLSAALHAPSRMASASTGTASPMPPIVTPHACADRNAPREAPGDQAWIPRPAVQLADATAPETAASPGVQRVAVLRIQFRGDMPEGHREAIGQRLVEGLAVAAFQVVEGPRVARRLGEVGLADCADADCYPKVASALDVGYLVEGEVIEDSKNYDISLLIVNGRNGDTIGTARERCETCGIAEVAEKVSLAAVALRTRLESLAKTPSTVVIRTNPAGATVTVNGQPKGAAPFQVQLPGGRHHVSASLRDHVTAERDITVVSGVDESIELELLRIPSPFNHRLWGWVAVATGAAALATSAYLAWQDAKPIACGEAERDINGVCPNIRDFDAAVWTLSLVGGAALGLGGVSLWVASREAGPGARPEGMSPAPVAARWAPFAAGGLMYAGRF